MTSALCEPFTNPFVDTKSARCHDTGWSGKASLKCQEIFSYGLRNPFRFAVDPNVDGSRTRLFINDVGRHTWESVREGGDGFAGGNYGESNLRALTRILSLRLGLLFMGAYSYEIPCDLCFLFPPNRLP